MRGMKSVLRGALLPVLAIAAIAASPTTAAQTCPTQTSDPGICVTVTGAPSVATSMPGAPTYWTVTVKIRNGAANPLNRVAFAGQLTDTAFNPAEAYFVDPLTGQPSANPVYLNNSDATISCALLSPVEISCGGIGTSIPAGKTLSFNLMTTTPFNAAQIRMDWQSRFSEGSSTSDGAENGAAEAVGDLTTSVSPPTGNTATASFPGTGGTLATAADTFTTRILIPGTGKATDATIIESPNSDPLCKNFRPCYSSDVSIPNFGVTQGLDFLKVDLYMAESNIKKGTRIEKAQIVYSGELLDGTPVVNAPVYMCSGLNVPNGDGMPCINLMVNFKSSRSIPTWTTPVTPTAYGFYWQLINVKNGRFTLW